MVSDHDGTQTMRWCHIRHCHGPGPSPARRPAAMAAHRWSLLGGVASHSELKQAHHNGTEQRSPRELWWGGGELREAPWGSAGG
jgi:hypothetical protein